MDRLDLRTLQDGAEIIIGLSGKNVLFKKLKGGEQGVMLSRGISVYWFSDTILELGKQFITNSGEWLGTITYFDLK